MEPLSPDPGGSHDNFRAPTMSIRDMLPESTLPPAFDEPSVFNPPAPTTQSDSGLFPRGKGVSNRLFAEVDTNPDNRENKSLSHTRRDMSMSVEDVSRPTMWNRGDPSLRDREASKDLTEGIASGMNSLRGRVLDVYSSVDWSLSFQINTLPKADIENRDTTQTDDYISFQQTIASTGQSAPELSLQDTTAFTRSSGAPLEGLSKETAIDLSSDDDSVPPRFLSQRNEPRRDRKLVHIPGAKRLMRQGTRKSLGAGKTSKTSKMSKESKGPDLQLLVAHRDLSYWKDKHYRELGIDAEYQLVLRMGQIFKPASIQTIVPDRYLRPMHKQGHRRPAFPGVIVAGGRPVEAIRKAYEEHTPTSQDFGRLVFWTDGSGSNNSSGRGMGVVFRTTLPGGVGWSPWIARGYVSFGKSIGTFEVEGLAMVKAIDLACEMVRAEPRRFTAIAIYTDALSVLEQIRNHSPRPLCERIVKKAMGLRREGSNPTITLHWCPGHSKVPGNTLADRVAGISAAHIYKGNDKEMVELSSDDEEGE